MAVETHNPGLNESNSDICFERRKFGESLNACVMRGGGGPTFVDDFGNRHQGNGLELDLGNNRMLTMLETCAMRPKLPPRTVTRLDVDRRKEEQHKV